MGFGGAFTEAAALNFGRLPSTNQDQLLEAYFGHTGIGYSLGRVHINSCDFCVASYNFDDQAGDYDLRFFDSNVTHDTHSMLPFIRRAMAKRMEAQTAQAQTTGGLHHRITARISEDL